MPDDTELDGTDDLWSHIDGLSLGEIEEELNGKHFHIKKASLFREAGAVFFSLRLT
jgi:hypothetical protein